MKTMTVKELAQMTRGELVGDGETQIDGVASLLDATPSQVSFLANKKYARHIMATKAGAIIIPADYDGELPAGKSLLKCANPNAAFQRAVDSFAPPAIKYEPGIHPSAVVSPNAQVDPSCHVGPCAVIDDGAVIGKGTVICPGVHIGRDVKIGSKCLIYSNTVIRERCEIGNRVVMHTNVSIGNDGFGYEPGPMGVTKIPQVGIVKIEDDVEIGSNSTIDRARFGKTHIKQGAKFDCQVHIAHNVVVGEFSMLIGQCGVAGSTEIGRGVIVAAQAGINGHIKIGDGAKIAGTAGVVKDVEPGDIMIGTPAETKREFTRRLLLPKTIDKLAAKLEAMEKTIAELKSQLAAKA